MRAVLVFAGSNIRALRKVFNCEPVKGEPLVTRRDGQIISVLRGRHVGWRLEGKPPYTVLWVRDYRNGGAPRKVFNCEGVNPEPLVTRWMDHKIRSL